MNAQHSSKSNEHYTPEDIVKAARAVMGGIDLDPASSHEANLLVGASEYFTKDDDGLSKDWHGRVWLNPPGGLIGRQSSAAVWWEKLFDEWNAGSVTQAMFLGFSIEILQTSQDAAMWIGRVPFCIPRKRLRFVQFDAARGEFVPGNSPTHANIIAYLPPALLTDAYADRFEAAFSPFGAVRT